MEDGRVAIISGKYLLTPYMYMYLQLLVLLECLGLLYTVCI